MSARTASFVSKRAQRFVPIAVSLKEVGQVPGARERGPFLVVAETTCHDDVVEAVVSAVAPWDEVIDLASSPDRPSTVEASPGLELKQSSGDTGKESTLAVLGRPTCCRVWHATARYTANAPAGGGTRADRHARERGLPPRRRQDHAGRCPARLRRGQSSPGHRCPPPRNQEHRTRRRRQPLDSLEVRLFQRCWRGQRAHERLLPAELQGRGRPRHFDEGERIAVCVVDHPLDGGRGRLRAKSFDKQLARLEASKGRQPKLGQARRNVRA